MIPPGVPDAPMSRNGIRTRSRSALLLCRIRLSLDAAIWRHGAGWCLSLLLLALAGLLDIAAVQPQKGQVELLHNNLTNAVRASGSHEPASADSRAMSDFDLQAELLDQLPFQSSLPAQIIALQQLAKSHEVSILQISYSNSVAWGKEDVKGAIPAGAMERVRLTLPVMARYGKLRAWLESILREFPNASLDGLNVKRRTASDHLLEAEVRISIWLRAGPPLALNAPNRKLAPANMVASAVLTQKPML